MKISSDSSVVIHCLYMCIHVQAYTGQLPTPEELRLRKESRSKILKAQGYYLPDPDAKKVSPTLERIRYIRFSVFVRTCTYIYMYMYMYSSLSQSVFTPNKRMCTNIHVGSLSEMMQYAAYNVHVDAHACKFNRSIYYSSSQIYFYSQTL